MCPQLLIKVDKLNQLQHKLNIAISNSTSKKLRTTANKLLEAELVQTNKIEGILLNRDLIRNLLVNETGDKNSDEQRLIDIYLKILDDNIIINTPDDISRLYYQLLDQYIDDVDKDLMGNFFRLDGVEIVTKSNKVIHTGVNAESNIYSYLDAALEYVHNQNSNYFIAIAAFHYFFGYIHPFYDGNGRMIRLITSALLYPKISIASLAISDVIAQNQSTYYKMFDETNSVFNVNDITSFVYRFLEFIEEAIITTIDHLEY